MTQSKTTEPTNFNGIYITTRGLEQNDDYNECKLEQSGTVTRVSGFPRPYNQDLIMHGNEAGTSLFISPDGKKFYAIIGRLEASRNDFTRRVITNSICLVGDVGGELENVARGLMAEVLDPETHEQARTEIDSYLTDKPSSDSSVEFNGIYVNVSGLLEYLDSLAIQENAETESKISESIIHCDKSGREFYTSKPASEIVRNTKFSDLGAKATIVVTEISGLLLTATEMQNNPKNKLKKEEKEVLKNYRLVYGSGSIASMQEDEELKVKLQPVGERFWERKFR